MNYSVPQGSVLGPFLFLCYLGGLPKYAKDVIESTKFCMYADDISLSIFDKDLDIIEEKCNDTILLLKNVLSKNE